MQTIPVLTPGIKQVACGLEPAESLCLVEPSRGIQVEARELEVCYGDRPINVGAYVDNGEVRMTTSMLRQGFVGLAVVQPLEAGIRESPQLSVGVHLERPDAKAHG